MDSLETIRLRINEVDKEIIKLLAVRTELAEQVRDYKKKNKMTALSQDRWNELTRQHRQWSKELGVDYALVEPIFEHVHHYVLENIHSELR